MNHPRAGGSGDFGNPGQSNRNSHDTGAVVVLGTGGGGGGVERGPSGSGGGMIGGRRRLSEGGRRPSDSASSKTSSSTMSSSSQCSSSGSCHHSSAPRHRHRRRHSNSCSDGETSSSSSGSGSSETTSSGEPNLPYPGFPEISLKYLTQTTRPRNWCLLLITNPWFERVSILVILLNCITLGMYQPCVDDACVTNRCKILQIFDDIIFVFFGMEMTIKMVAMGVYGKNTYLADSWNRLDFFIVLAGALEYCLQVENLNLTAIRTIRVLRPLRAINRIPSMRILVMLLLDTLPMLGNVLLLCFFVFFIFGIVGVQLWEGILRQRCALDLPPHIAPPNISYYYEFSKEQDYICSKPEDSGMHLCSGLPPYRIGPLICNGTAVKYNRNLPTNTSCVNWNQYYTNCTQLGGNPFQGTISFDNIGLAWVAIFLVISLEGWTDIMYYVQDAHSFWDWIYFVLLIVIGSFFMINLCLVVIATQFSETKKREMERMRQERARFTSTSTLASSTNNSEPTSCYAEIVKYIAHLWRRLKRRLIKKYQRQQRKEGLIPNQAEVLTLSPSRIRTHHPKCHKYNTNNSNNSSSNLNSININVNNNSSQQKTTNIPDQLITVMVPLNASSNSTNNNSTAQINNFNNNYITNNNNNNNNGNINLNNDPSNNNSNNNSISSLNKNNHNNHHDSQISSPDNSEMSLDHHLKGTVGLLKNTNNNNNNSSANFQAHNQSRDDLQKTILLKIPNLSESEQLLNERCGSGFLSPPTSARRRSSVMFNEFVILHTPPAINSDPNLEKNVNSSEKMTQTGDGNIWQVNLPNNIGTLQSTALADCSDLSLNDAMTCQELLAFSVAFSAALPTGHTTLESFYSSLARDHHKNNNNNSNLGGNEMQNSIPAAITTTTTSGTHHEDFSCCYQLYQNALAEAENEKRKQKSKFTLTLVMIYNFVSRGLGCAQRHVKRLVEHKYFQQGILLAILINTLSMGIEYHNQPEELTAIVETSNIVFSAIFAVEMLLKIIAEGPFRYIANGFNVFDGVIVILSIIELCQTFSGNREGNSGLSVLRTFRLLRILKLVRFMPNLRRQLFVMLRTMDNVAIFFSLLILFIFIFSILGMYLFGGKFCKFMDDATGQERECTCPEIVSKHPQCECDRKHFNNFLWATVTVFQILTQEDWNVVLFNGMEKTSHWAALYFVALMTFGNYVLFNLLVAILVEGFSSERNERREREQRELVKKLREENLSDNINDLYDEARSYSDSTTTSDSYHEIKNKWRSAEELRKQKHHCQEPKCNIQKQKLLQPTKQLNSNESLHHHHHYPYHHHRHHHRRHHHHHQKRHHNQNYPPNLHPNLPSKNLDRQNSSKSRHGSIRLEKSASMRDRSKREPLKLENLNAAYEPPMITTTAATPQDSPNTTHGADASFPNWDTSNLELTIDKTSCQSIPSLLKPPPLLGSLKVLDEKLHFEKSSSISSLDTKSKIPKSSNDKLGTALELPATLNASEKLNNTHGTTVAIPSTVESQVVVSSGQLGGVTSPPQANQQPSTSTFQRSSSFKKFRRSSSKRKKAKTKSESDSGEVILNNGRDHTQLNRNELLLQTVNRIQNDTKEDSTYNKFMSPQALMQRRLSASGGGHRRASYAFNNSSSSQLYQNLSRRSSKNLNSPISLTRRMSSIEHAYEKVTNINIYNFEHPGQNKSDTSPNKIDINSLQKSLSNIPSQENALNEFREAQQLPPVRVSKIKALLERLKPKEFTDEREDYSLYIFPHTNSFRRICTWFVNQKWFDNVVLLFIALNCITLAMERPNIPPKSNERMFLAYANNVFTVVFTLEMLIKVIAAGMFYGHDAYFTSGWNIMDGSLVIISIIDLLMSLISESSPRIFGILRVFRLLRSLRPLRVINRAPGLKLVVQTLLSSLRPIGNIVLICCTFFIIFGILGVQLFKGTFYYCEGEFIKGVKNKTDCLSNPNNVWINRKYNFDDLGKALMSLFVLSSRDGWVNIMYTGLDAVGVDQQPIVNYNEWRLLYFIAFILLVGFFVLNMFVGVVVENFHRCREEQEKEEKLRRAAKRVKQMEKKRKRMNKPPYYTNYSPLRLFVHNVVTSKYFDLAIAAVIGLNVVTMAMEYYMMPMALEYALKIFNYFFTAVFILEAIMKLVALGIKLYLKDKWNQLDVAIVILSIVGIVLEELETNIIPINPTIIRVMRVLRIARVLKLLKMAKGIRALLDTVMQALPQVGNLGLLFFLLFFIFAALGVELFGRLECSDELPCQGLGEHAHFANFGMAFLTLFRVATGDNWNGIMKDTLRDDCDDAADCVRNCCVSTVIAPIFFVIFVLMAQFVLVNVVVAVLMKHLEESHKQMEDDLEIDNQLEREYEKSQNDKEDQELCLQLEDSENTLQKRPLVKVSSLPANFTYNTPIFEKKYNAQRRQTVQYFHQALGLSDLRNVTTSLYNTKDSISEVGEIGVNEEDTSEIIPEIEEGSRGGSLKKRYPKKRLWKPRLSQDRSFDEEPGEIDSKIDSPKLKPDLSPQILPPTFQSKPVPERDSEIVLVAQNIEKEKFESLPTFEPRRPHIYGRSQSTDCTPKSSYLSVPRLQPRSRSGSTKQLFKQAAVEEDPDIDESTLLLPNIPRKAPPIEIAKMSSASTSVDSSSGTITVVENEPKRAEKSCLEAPVDTIRKSESSEILRIISERRRVDGASTSNPNEAQPASSTSND